MTTNSISQGRITEHIDGQIAAANERGVRLAGEDTYRNFSRWAGPIAPPGRGQHVRLGLDVSGFVRELQVLHDAPSAPSATSRDREIRRQACLKAAAIFAAGKCLASVEVKSTDVLAIAEAWERWVLASEAG